MASYITCILLRLMKAELQSELSGSKIFDNLGISATSISFDAKFWSGCTVKIQSILQAASVCCVCVVLIDICLSSMEGCCCDRVNGRYIILYTNVQLRVRQCSILTYCMS